MHDPTHLFEGTLSPREERVAKFLSLIGQPPFLSIIPFVAMSLYLSPDLTSGILNSFACIFAAVILPLVIIIYFSKRYSNADKLDVENREQRMVPLICGVFGYTLGTGILYALSAPWMVTVLMICYAVVTFAILLISLFWKISIHACGVMGPSMGLTAVFFPWGALYFLFLPFVAWSRYKLRKHTPLQLVMGAVVGAAITAVLFYFLL